MRKAPVAALVVFTLAALPGLTQTGSGGISLTKAVTIGQTGGLTLLYARAEMKGGSPLWGMYFLAPMRKVLESEISRSSGAVLKNETVDKIGDPGPGVPAEAPQAVLDALQTRVLAKLPNTRYIQIALEKNGGDANGFALLISNGQVVVQVSGTGANGGSWQTTMDMATGQVLSNKGS